ncbi:hypothetical protein O0I10_008492 [Lichtheimia ornata]|uniref:RRM domain-containing protein n=1 Tax=Lichtheimia ornata TaxID=688661 RepID=A0AAD7UZG1_9FUNG|nr:uncharacterized protein O0I10_008492 [Lichtheimia ornata]KAJ8655828.1 hypothetical protein O0I10_008492 [Lichtheimia ornata]
MPPSKKTEKKKVIDIEQHESSSDESDSEQEQQQQQKQQPLKRKAEEEPEQQHMSKKATTGNSLFVGQLNKKATRQEISDFFSQAGTVVDVRMKKTMKNRENNPGYCHVEMSSPAEKEAALQLHGTDFQGFKLNLDDASNFKPKGRRNDKLSAPSNTLFVANLPFEADRDYVKYVFEKFGDIERVSRIMAKGYDTGIAYVEFKDMKNAVTALQSMQGESVKGRPIRLDYAEKRKNNKPHPLKKKNFVKEQMS